MLGISRVIEQRHQAFQVFDLLIGDGVEVSVPHSNVITERSTAPAVFEHDLFIQRTSSAPFGAEYLLFGQVELMYYELA